MDRTRFIFGSRGIDLAICWICLLIAVFALALGYPMRAVAFALCACLVWLFSRRPAGRDTD